MNTKFGIEIACENKDLIWRSTFKGQFWDVVSMIVCYTFQDDRFFPIFFSQKLFNEYFLGARHCFKLWIIQTSHTQEVILA